MYYVLHIYVVAISMVFFFVELLAVGTGVSFALLPDLRTPFLLLGKLSQS